MNPLPIGPIVDAPAGLVPDGHLRLLMLLTIVAVLALSAVFLWAMRRTMRARERLRCPARLSMARVVFSLAPDGSRMDVLKCSLLRGRPVITCGKACLGAAKAA